MEDFTPKFLLENNTGEVKAAGTILIYFRIYKQFSQIGDVAILSINNYILGFIRGNDSIIYLFDSQGKDKKDNLSSSGTAIILKFNKLYSLKTYMKSVYYDTNPLTLHFQV